MAEPYIKVYDGPEECPKIVRGVALIDRLEKMARRMEIGIGKDISSLYNEGEVAQIRSTYREALDNLLRAAGLTGNPGDKEDIPTAEYFLIQLMQVAGAFPDHFLGSRTPIEQHWIKEAEMPIDYHPDDEYCRSYYVIRAAYKSRDRDDTGWRTRDGERGMQDLLDEFKPSLIKHTHEVFSRTLQHKLAKDDVYSNLMVQIDNAARTFSSATPLWPAQFIGRAIKFVPKKLIGRKETKAAKFIDFEGLQHRIGTLQDQFGFSAYDLLDLAINNIPDGWSPTSRRGAIKVWSAYFEEFYQTQEKPTIEQLKELEIGFGNEQIRTYIKKHLPLALGRSFTENGKLNLSIEDTEYFECLSYAGQDPMKKREYDDVSLVEGG